MKLSNVFVNRRQALAMGLTGAIGMTLAACGGSNGSNGSAASSASSATSSTSAEPIEATVTVWGPQEDQTEADGKWLQTQCEAFAAAHPEWTLTFKYGVCSEADAKKTIGTDPSAGADVYLYANDQIPDLIKAGGIAELGGAAADAVKTYNSQTTVDTVMYNGSLYGLPFTVNTWFMFYDKSVFSSEDVKSLEAMLEKGKVAIPMDTSWYVASFYIANGCTLFGKDGNDADAGFDFGGDKAVEVTNYLVDMVANKNFANGNISNVGDAKAFFSGTWDYEQALAAYGENLGVVPAPSITLGGSLKQLKAFAGSKAVGVNPATALYGSHPEVAVALATFLGGPESQEAHYKLRKIIPTDTSIMVDDALAQAQMDTMKYTSIVQPLQADMVNFWTPVDSMGMELVAGSVTHENAAEKTEAMNKAVNSKVIQ